MKIAFITAGAAGMYCGSCLRDNTLARSLMRQGHDVTLVPTYTPTRTDEPNVSQSRVFLGGINIYLQHKFAFFRHTPWLADRLLDSRRLLSWVSRFGMKTAAADLGALTLSMLRGEEGPDRKEFVRLADWIARELRPDVVDLSNGLLLGIARSLRHTNSSRVVCTLSGEDLFLDHLPADCTAAALELLRGHVAHVDAFIAFNEYYADRMGELLAIPRRKIHLVPLGVNLQDCRAAPVRNAPQRHGEFTIGYLGRICPEKGLHILVEAFHILRERGRTDCRLHAAGYLGPRDRRYLEEIQDRVRQWGLSGAFEYVGELDRHAKMQFLQSLDVFSLPAVYRESKGLPVLEAWANHVPVVQPRHGSFTELVTATGGGILVDPEDPVAVAAGIAQLLDDPALRHEMGRRGREAVEQRHSDRHMADATVAVYQQLLNTESCPTT